MLVVRTSIIAVAILNGVGASFSGSQCCAQRSRTAGIEIATIDANTRWTFRAVSPVTVASPIVRLGDVVRPVDPNMAGWQRLRNSPIGLVPVSGQAMTVDRDRLAKAIRNAEATPLAIDWIGPEQIRVVFDPANAPPSALHERKAEPTEVFNLGRNQINRVSYNAPNIGPISNGRPGDSIGSVSSGRTENPLPESVARQVVYWIDLAIKRQLPSISEAYERVIDHAQPGLVPLRSISGVTQITPVSALEVGVVVFHVVGRSPDGPVETDVEIQLSELPTIVTTRTTIARGTRITANDLEIQPIQNDKLDSTFIVDPAEIIGLEARTTLRSGRPIANDQVGSPILVHRGDLVEIRVLAGGVTVTTNAKALRDGAVSDLIEIETMRPRKRLVARVVDPGMVEIVTRAPNLRAGS